MTYWTRIRADEPCGFFSLAINLFTNSDDFDLLALLLTLDL